MIDKDGNYFWLVPVLIGAAIGAYQGYNIGKMNNAKGWEMVGYFIGGAIIGGIAGYAGVNVANAGFAGAGTLGLVTGSMANSYGMYFLSNGKTDINISVGALSVNMSKGEIGYLGKEGNSVLQNLGYALGAYTNLSDLGKVGSAVLQTEKVGLGHSAVTTDNGKPIIDFGPDRTQGALARAVQDPDGASLWYSKVTVGAPSTNRFGFDGATPTPISRVNTTTLQGYGKFLDFMTTKGVFGVKMPYSFLYSSCSTQSGLGLLLSGIPNIGFTPWLLQQSVQLWNIGVTQSLLMSTYNLQY